MLLRTLRSTNFHLLDIRFHAITQAAQTVAAMSALLTEDERSDDATKFEEGGSLHEASSCHSWYETGAGEYE